MSELQIIISQCLVLWVMIAGIAYMVRGSRGAGAVVRWPIVATFRLLRRAAGGLFVILGSWIRG